MGLNNVVQLLGGNVPPVSTTERASVPATERTHVAAADRTSTCSQPSVPVPNDVTILRHCRCVDCRRFAFADGQYFCSEYIGGTFSVVATGQRVCEPAPEAWHYCSRYDGPQVSNDVWIWRKATPTSHHVGPRSNISLEVEQPANPADAAAGAQSVKGGKVGDVNRYSAGIYKRLPHAERSGSLFLFVVSANARPPAGR